MNLYIKYALIIAILALSELVYIRIADRYNIIDKPNERSSHSFVIVRGGGIVYLIGVWLLAAFFGLGDWPFLLGLTLIAGISLLDDVRPLPDYVRLVVHFLSMGLMFYDWGILHPDMWWMIILSLILCVGIVNAYNFMDGINGINGAYGMAVLLPLIWFNREANFAPKQLIIVTVLANLVFLFFNFRPKGKAKCFAGDVGSVGMAYILIYLLGLLIVKTNDFTYIVLLAVYGVDTVLTICHRILLHENLGVAHRKHAYQIMANELHIGHIKVASLYAMLQLMIAVGFSLIPSTSCAHWLYLIGVVAILSAAYILFMKKYYHLHKEKDNFSTSTMKNKRIYLCLARMSEEALEQKYVKEAFDTNYIVPLGPNVNGFEADLDAFVQQDRKVAALSSGTAAVHLSLLACGVGPGDEVCVQSFTFCASSHPITYLGATPVFIDSEPDTWNMDPDLLETAIKDRIAKTGRKPKAIVPVSLYGMPYQIDRIMAIAQKYDIPVIEDAAEGFGSRFDGQLLGTFGKYGVFSFNGNKMITTSGGGALVCTSEEDKNTIMWYATQARDAYPYYQHSTVGYNYRMSNICAGIGRGQLTVADAHIKHHQHIQKLYESLLASVPGISVHSQPSDPRYDSNYWLCTICIDPELRIKGQENVYKQMITKAVGGASGVIHAVDTPVTDCQPNDNVEALRVWMDAAGIEARPVWKPMHRQPVYKDAPAYVNGVSESIFKVGMCIPAGPCVTDEDVVFIVDTIKDAIA